MNRFFDDRFLLYLLVFLLLGSPGICFSKENARKDFNILDHAGPFDRKMDFSDLINKGLASKNVVRLPKIDQDYLISKTLILPEGSALECDVGVRIISNSTAMFFRIKGEHTTIKNCIFDYQGHLKSSVGLVDQAYFTWDGGGSQSANGLAISGANAKFAKVMNTRHLDSTGTAITLINGASQNSILNNEIQNAKGFGVWATLGANNNLIQGNWSSQNRIELVGITSTSFDNKVINNSAKNTGDNCFSITGTGNTVIGNYGQNCGFAGLYVYGSRNTVTGNMINGAAGVQDPKHPYYQPSNKLKYGAITVSGSWSGAAQLNVVTSNDVSDERQKKTTAYGVKVGEGYPTFKMGMPISEGGYVYHAMNIYQALASGKTGSMAPTCTSGICSDGSIQWKWVNRTEQDSAEPVGNVIAGNVVADLPETYVDFTKKKANQVQHEPLAARSMRAQSDATQGASNSSTVGAECVPFQAGTEYKLGDLVVFNRKVYRRVNAGGVAKEAPSHGKGAVTGSDGVAWFFINPGFLKNIAAASSCEK